LTRFSRRATWLTNFFTASQAPASPSFPDSYSRDVSLTQPYDGGGWGLQEPNGWGTSVNPAVAASGTQTVVSTNATEIFRILALAAENLAGVNPNAWWNITLPNAMSFPITFLESIGSGKVAYWGGTHPPIMGPSMNLEGFWSGGDGATNIRFWVLGVKVPIGTVFPL